MNTLLTLLLFAVAPPTTAPSPPSTRQPAVDADTADADDAAAPANEAQEPSPEEVFAAAQAEARELIEGSRPANHLPPRLRSELLKVEVRSDLLQFRVLLDEQTPFTEVPLTDYPGLSTVNIREPGVSGSYMHQTADAPGRTMQITQVAMLPGRLTIARDYETLTTQGSVQFTQNYNENIPSESPVTLRVNVQAIDNDPTADIDQYITANSFTDLRQRFPSQFETYLLPIITDLSPGFGPYPPGAAAQVLINDLQVDPAVREQLDALLPALDAEAFRDRRAARRKLNDLGVEAAATALSLRESVTPEQKAALDDLILRYKVLDDADAARLRDDPEFLIYALADENQAVRDAAARRLRQLRPNADVPETVRPVSQAMRSELRSRLGLN